MKGRWILAGLISATLLAGAWWRCARAPTKMAVARTAMTLTGMAGRRPPVRYRAEAPQVIAPLPDPPKVEASPSMTREVFFAQFADELCLCPDDACVREVTVRYNGEIGTTGPLTNRQSLHESALRMRECEERIRSGG